MINFISDKVKSQLNPQAKKYYAVMLFDTEINLGISSIPNKWKNIRNIIFDNGTNALTYYSEIPNPASQLIDAQDIDELNVEMNIMYQNFSDENWLNNNLYPYL